MSTRPLLIVLAGPNGAGKSTLYKTRVARLHPDAEFVNADLLATAHFGHNANTLEESQKGQELANERRDALMEARKDLVTESTFSHPSKLKLIEDAQAQGYRVYVHHVNVRSPDVSVARVAQRVQDGGHPVPEQKIRERYERNQQLIRSAVKMADRAVVWDNSRLNKPPMLALEFNQGQVKQANKLTPAWAQELYGPDIKRHFSLKRLNAPAASFKDAKELVAQADPSAKLFIARPGNYRGTIAAETDLHVIQKLDAPQGRDKEAGNYVAHFKNKFRAIPKIGTLATIAIRDGVKFASVFEHTPERVAAQAALQSLKAAAAFAKRIAGDQAQVEEAERGKKYQGPVLGESPQHIIQGGQTQTSFTAHNKNDLSRVPKVGSSVTINYPESDQDKAKVSAFKAPTQSKAVRVKDDELER